MIEYFVGHSIREKRLIKVFLSSFIIIFISYLTDSFFITPYSDDLFTLGREMDHLKSQGKIFFNFFDKILIGGLRAPLTLNFLYVFLISLSLFCSIKIIFKSFIISNNTFLNNLFLTISIACSGNFIFFLIVHEHTKVMVVFSGFLSIMSIFFTIKPNAFKSILSILLFFIASGIYLPSVLFGISTVFLSMFNSIFDTELKSKDFYKSEDFKLFIIRILIVIISIIIFYFFLKFFNTQLWDNNAHPYSFSQINFSINSIFKNILRSIVSSSNIFLWRGTLNLTIAYIYRIITVLFALSYVFMVIRNNTYSSIGKGFKILFLSALCFFPFFFFDFQILNFNAVYFRRFYLHQSVFLLFFLLFLFKHFKKHKSVINFLVIISLLLIWKSVFLLNTYSYNRALNHQKQLIHLNRIVSNVQDKLNLTNLERSCEYKIHFADNRFRRYNSFKNLPIEYDNIMRQVQDPSFTVATAKFFIAEQLSLKIDKANIWDGIAPKNSFKYIEDEVFIDEKSKIIWVNTNGENKFL